MVRRTREAYGALHVLHNNVGGTDTSRDNTVVEMDWSYWNTAITLNLSSTVYACRCAIPLMIESGGGSIVNTSSMVALSGDVRPTAYAAAKGGVISFTRFVATQYGKQGIRCNAIAPGLILTPRATPRPQAVLDIFERHTLAPQHGQPEDIAYTALFLASDESRFINGQSSRSTAARMCTTRRCRTSWRCRNPKETLHEHLHPPPEPVRRRGHRPRPRRRGRARRRHARRCAMPGSSTASCCFAMRCTPKRRTCG